MRSFVCVQEEKKKVKFSLGRLSKLQHCHIIVYILFSFFFHYIIILFRRHIVERQGKKLLNRQKEKVLQVNYSRELRLTVYLIKWTIAFIQKASPIHSFWPISVCVSLPAFFCSLLVKLYPILSRKKEC